MSTSTPEGSVISAELVEVCDVGVLVFIEVSIESLPAHAESVGDYCTGHPLVVVDGRQHLCRGESTTVD